MQINKLLKFKELAKYIPLSRSTIWRRIQAGTFPRPLNLGSNVRNSAKAWNEEDVLAWIKRQQEIAGQE